jgi:hypothetical protein
MLVFSAAADADSPLVYGDTLISIKNINASSHHTSLSNPSDVLEFVNPYTKGTFQTNSQDIHREENKFLLCGQISYLIHR